jgi:hypothetical protein
MSFYQSRYYLSSVAREAEHRAKRHSDDAISELREEVERLKERIAKVEAA